MAISTNQKPTIYRNLYENTGPASSCMIVSLATTYPECPPGVVKVTERGAAQDQNVVSSSIIINKLYK